MQDMLYWLIPHYDREMVSVLAYPSIDVLCLRKTRSAQNDPMGFVLGGFFFDCLLGIVLGKMF